MKGPNKFIALTLLSVVSTPGCATKENLREKHQRQALERWLKWAEIDQQEMIQQEDDVRASLERSALEAEKASEVVEDEEPLP